MSTSMMEVPVPESQRLIAVSLGKIAASRGQKGGINLHKNLLVATVLHKARTAYMIQHINAAKQRATPVPAPVAAAAAQSVEMRDQTVPEPSSTPPSSSPPSSPAGPTFQTAAPSSSSPAAAPLARSAGVAASPESGWVPGGADVRGSAQVAECEDKENTPPPPTSPSSSLPLRDATSTLTTTTTTSLECEKRLQEQPMDVGRDVKDMKPLSPVTQTQQPHHANTRDYISGGKACANSCLLKRRRAMDTDHENVSAPKVRILDSRLSPDGPATSSSEAMQCDSPQISNLVNIFHSGFSGLSSVPPSHAMADSLTCAKEIKSGLDSLHQPIVLSV